MSTCAALVVALVFTGSRFLDGDSMHDALHTAWQLRLCRCLLSTEMCASFCAGGAYPELPLLQYPLDMGRPEEQRGKQTLAVAVDIEGNANYDAIVRQGARANKIIHTGHQALIPKLDLMDPQVSTK
jgi:hypothetical protein